MLSTARLFALALSVVVSGAAFAQHHHTHPFKVMPAPFPLLPDMGDLNHPVSTKDPIAQKYFNQGLTLIYGFNYSGAYASFREAALKDMDLAMAHWGMALASGANINIDIDADRMKLAAEHIKIARAKRATDPEKEYINALGKRYSDTPETADKLRLAIDYQRAMRALAEKYPPKVDPDASTLYAEALMDLRPWRLWSVDGQPYAGTQYIVQILEDVIAAHPDHVGAVHYHLHALEPSPKWRDAMPDAVKLQKLVPGSGHLIHMPSHIFLLAGEYDMAAKANEDAIARDKWYQQNAADDGYVGHYLSHNMHFLAVVRTMQGDFNKAIAAAREAVANVERHPEEPGLEHYRTTPTLVLARFGKWDELLKNEPDAKLKIAHAMWVWGKAIALAAQKRMPESRVAQAQFKKEAADCAAYLSWGNNPTSSLLNIADLVLSAAMARADGDAEAVSRILKLAQDAEAELLYDEPPPWFIPLDLDL